MRGFRGYRVGSNATTLMRKYACKGVVDAWETDKDCYNLAYLGGHAWRCQSGQLEQGAGSNGSQRSSRTPIER
jgi:hypothetical protein